MLVSLGLCYYPFVSGTVLALVLDTPIADLVIGNYVNTSILAIAKPAGATETVKPFVSEISEPCRVARARSEKLKVSTDQIKAELAIEKYREDQPLRETFQINNEHFDICSREEFIKVQQDDGS